VVALSELGDQHDALSNRPAVWPTAGDSERLLLTLAGCGCSRPNDRITLSGRQIGRNARRSGGKNLGHTAHPNRTL